MTSASTLFRIFSAGFRVCTCANMRCCDGLPQHVWHQTSVFARRPRTVLLNTSSHELGVDDLVDDAARREQVDLRLFHLDDGAAGVGERVQLFVERVAQCPDALADVLVVKSCTANATRLGVTVPNLTGLSVMRCAALYICATASDRGRQGDDARHQARFDVVVQDVAAREADAAAADGGHLRNASQPLQTADSSSSSGHRCLA